MTPENNSQRLKTIRKAGQSLALSIFPATGYNPEKIGRALADSIMESISKDCPIETDLGHECLSLILDATLKRMNEIYEKVRDGEGFHKTSFPSPSYEGEEDETPSL